MNNASADDCKHYSLARDGTGLKLSENFTLIEFACKDGNDTVIVHPALVELLQKLRDHYGVPVSINSAYRTPSHNSAIGGAKNSRHMFGFAADVSVFEVPPVRVAELLIFWGVGGVGKYLSFVHADVYGELRRWEG